MNDEDTGTEQDLLEPPAAHEEDRSPEEAPKDKNLEDAFQNLFKTSASGTGEEELLRIASTYSLQISAQQIKALLYLEWLIPHLSFFQQEQVKHFVERWLELKQHNNSDLFVMRALDAISLRKFVGENAFKVNIEK